MASIQSAFRDKIRSPDDYLNMDAADVHIVPYVTGGLGRLMKHVREDNVPQLHEFGYHTDEEGHFSPEDSCTMVLRYKVKKILDAKGQSAVLVLAEDAFRNGSLVVIKVLHTEFYRLGVQESHVLWRLAMTDPLNHSHTLRILTTFTFDSHYCLVFEPLLPDPLTTIFLEFPSHKVMSNIRKIGLRLLATLGFLHQQNLIHTDLKPENILLKYENDLDSVHIVDFGNTINYVHSEVSLYYKDFELQTPLYRAPEVMFGVPFGPEIDIWSLGCIFAELYLGKPLLYGESTKDILKQMYELLGPFPAKLFRRGKFYKNLKQYTTSMEQENTSSMIYEHLQYVDYLFADLLCGMLKYDPDERLTASEAAQHPFFASHFPVAFLLPSNSGINNRLSVPLSKQAYPYSPNIAASIKKGQPSSIDLLRIGTTDVQPANDLDETTILKPSPRYKMKGQNLSILDEQTKFFPSDFETSGDMTPKTHSQYAKPVKSDISVVKNVITERKDRFSDNVKEKMTSLLKAIRQEQVLVENNLDQRFNNEVRSPIGNRGASGYRPMESVRPVPKYGAFKENVLNRSEGVRTLKEPQFMKSPKLEKQAQLRTEGTFIIPDKNGPFKRTHGSTEKHKLFDPNMEENHGDKKEIGKIFSCESKSNDEFVDKMNVPKSNFGSHHSFKHMKSPKYEAKISKSSEKDVKAPLSPGFTPSRTMYRTKWIDQASKNKTSSYNNNKSSKKLSGGKTNYTTLDMERLHESQSSASFCDRQFMEAEMVVSNINETFKKIPEQLKSHSPESRKRSRTNDISDDDSINILSPMAHGGSPHKRQKYVAESGGNSHKRGHALETRDYAEMELDNDVDEEDTRSQPYVSPEPHSYSNNDEDKYTAVDSSVGAYSAREHSYSEDGSGPIREEFNWRRLKDNSGHSKRIGKNSETVMKVKSKKRVPQGMPTPIEKQQYVFNDLSDHTATESPEIIYKTISRNHKVNKNKSATSRHSLDSNGIIICKGGTKSDSGDRKSLTGHDRKMSKYKVKSQTDGVTNRNYGNECVDYSGEIKSSSKTGNNMVIDKGHDKFSFLGTPASNKKLEGVLAERIAQRQRKLKKKARKSLNFQGEEDEISDESVDYENSSDCDSVDSISGPGIPGSHSVTYHNHRKLPMKYQGRPSETMSRRNNDQHFVEKLARSGQIVDKDMSQTRNALNKGTRYLNQDATFVLDFESPLRSNQKR